MIGAKYQTTNRTVQVLREEPGGYAVRIIADDPGVDDDGTPFPSQVGREFFIKAVQLFSAYNRLQPDPPEPPLTD